MCVCVHFFYQGNDSKKEEIASNLALNSANTVLYCYIQTFWDSEPLPLRSFSPRSSVLKVSSVFDKFMVPLFCKWQNQILILSFVMVIPHACISKQGLDHSLYLQFTADLL